MGRSIVVEVRKAVVAGLADLIDGHTSVTYGWQGASDDSRREEIYTNHPRATHEPAALKSGRNFRNEQMDFDLVILVIDPTKRPEEVDERAMELVEIAEEFIADHKGGEGFGITGLNWLIVTGLEMENRLMETGSATLAQLTLRYNARLT